MKTGSIVECQVTSIKPYGAFVLVEGKYNGLVHISELSDGFVCSISEYLKVGDTVELKVIDIDDQERISLSYKSLHKQKKKMKIMLTHGFEPLDNELNNWIKSYQFLNDK